MKCLLCMSVYNSLGLGKGSVNSSPHQVVTRSLIRDTQETGSTSEILVPYEY